MKLPPFVVKFLNLDKLTSKFHPNLLAKFSISFFLIMLLPFVFFTYFTYYANSEIIRKNGTLEANNNLAAFCYQMDRKLFCMEILKNKISIDKEVLYFNYILNIQFDKSTLNFNNKGLASQMSNIDDGSLLELCNIYMLSNQRSYNLYVQNNYLDLNTRYFNNNWYKQIALQQHSYFQIGTNIRHYLNGKKKYVISSASFLQDIGYTYSDVILIDCDYNLMIEKIFSKISNKKYLGNNFYVVDKNNNIMYHQNSGLLASKMGYPLIRTDETKLSGSSLVNMNNAKYYMAYYISPYNGWRYVTYIPFNSIDGSSPLLFNAYIILICALFLILVTVFAYLSSSAILSPINNLVKYMTEIKNGNFSARIKIKTNDETRLLSESFNNMASRLENMINRVYISEIKRKDAELLSLQSQINPHFLYNTLDCIRGKAITYEDQEIALMTKCLASMLKYSIEKDMVVPISYEIKHIENYFKIQNFRFDGKFELLIDMPEDFEEFMIIKLTLQPLIENSIIHGLEKNLGKGTVRVTFSRIDDIIKISIWDNGSGMSPEKIERLNEILKKGDNQKKNIFASGKSGKGIGIQNVNIRIQLYFGDQYGISFIKPEMGNTVEITIPFVNEENLHEIDYS